MTTDQQLLFATESKKQTVKTMEPPLVSVIVASYNYSRYLRQCVHSVLRQSHSNLECIIVDDCSTDDTREVVAGLMKEDLRVRYIYNEANKGEAGSRNVGIAAAQGEYLAALDADDWWEPTKLESQLEPLQSISGVFSFTAANTIRGDQNNPFRPDASWLASMNRSMREVNEITHSSVLIARSALRQVGGYDESLPYGVDWDLWLRILNHFGEGSFSFVDKPLVNYRWHEGNMSHNLQRTISGEWLVIKRGILRQGWGIRHPLASCSIIGMQLERQQQRYDRTGQKLKSAISALGCAMFSPLTPWRWKIAIRALIKSLR